MLRNADLKRNYFKKNISFKNICENQRSEASVKSACQTIIEQCSYLLPHVLI